jgi:hypothetical protein
MSVSSVAPCVVVLNQQREQEVSELCHSDKASSDHGKNKTKYCTVVENGKVVVKPVETEQ